MEQYIPKSVILAEIERRKKYYENIQIIKPVYESNIEDLNELLSFFSTLKVKEVDLEKEYDKFVGPIYEQDIKEAPFTYLWKCAKYFFELGLKVQKNNRNYKK